MVCSGDDFFSSHGGSGGGGEAGGQTHVNIYEADFGNRGFTRLRLSEFVQISEFFQFYITDIVRHLSHFPKVSI